MERLRTGFAAQDEGLSKAQRLAHAIMALIDQGIYKEGEALPSQRDIADEFQMALSVVSKVFTSLKKQGALYGERGRGSYVTFRARFAHDFGDRFTKDDAWLQRPPHAETGPVLCNLISRMSFLNDPLPEKLISPIFPVYQNHQALNLFVNTGQDICVSWAYT